MFQNNPQRYQAASLFVILAVVLFITMGNYENKSLTSSNAEIMQSML